MEQQRSSSIGNGMLGAPGGKKGRRFSCPSVSIVDNALVIKRAPYTQTAFDELHLRSEEEEKEKLADKLKKKCACSKQKLWKLISGYLPIMKVLRYYNIKENIVIDILSGITIGILHIPQALAFGLLTSVKIENGLYTSVWPVILYIIFGTSAHVSMGTSAVICIVTAAVVDRQADGFKLANPHLMNATGNATLQWEDIPEFMDYKESVAMGIAFFTGAILIAMGILRLGFITAYLSDSFFSAFTSGAGVHIATSQIPAILGLKVQRYGGVFKIVKTYSALFGAISGVNVATLIIAVLSGVVILLVKDCINDRYKHKLPIPIPIELFIVIITTLVSYFAHLNQNYGVDIVSSIPSTIPPPVMPTFSGVETYIVDCFVLAILIFANTIAMAKICAKRHNYEVDDSQELIAYGMCNFGGSFFRCFPSAVAPPRSMVASSMNTKTTVSGTFSAALLILLILVMSSLFEPLPKSALAAIIVVALKGLFIQLKDCVKFWKVNKIDFVIWFFTFFSVVFLDIDFGLGIGVIVSLITVVFQAQFARGYRLGRTMKDPAVVEYKKYVDSIEIPGIKVYKFHSNLFFANAEIFRMALYRATVNPRKLLKFIKKQENKKKKEGKTSSRRESTASFVHNFYNKQEKDVKSDVEIKIDLAKDDQSKVQEPSSTENPQTTASNGDSKSKFMRLESSSSTGSQRSSLAGIDNPAYKDEMQLSTISGDNGLLGPAGYTNGEFDLYKSRASITTITTINDEEDIDPEDGQEAVTDEKIRRMRKTHHVIVDCSTINYMDISGANVIGHISKEYDHVNIKLFLSNVCFDVRQTMRHAGIFDIIPEERVFLEVHDAIAVARLEMVLPLPWGMADFTDEEAAEDKYITKM